MRFSERIVIVTGAGAGIGEEIARRFCAEGAHVIVADVDGDLAKAAAATMEHARAVAVDVADRAGVRAMADRVAADHGRIDVLVNNAGVATDVPFTEITDDQWDLDVGVSMKGTFLCTQAVLPAMGEGASIVNVSSVNGLAYYGNDVYSAAKAGVLSLTRGIAVRYGPRGIRCNAVVPGTIATSSWHDRLIADPGRLDRLADWYPLRRVGTPADVAAAVTFLASDDARWITGAALPVDGGLLAGNERMINDLTGGL